MKTLAAWFGIAEIEPGQLLGSCSSTDLFDLIKLLIIFDRSFWLWLKLFFSWSLVITFACVIVSIFSRGAKLSPDMGHSGSSAPDANSNLPDSQEEDNLAEYFAVRDGIAQDADYKLQEYPHGVFRSALSELTCSSTADRGDAR